MRDTIKESFKVRPEGTFFLDIDYGSIEVASRRGNEVVVEVERVVEAESRAAAKEVLSRHQVSFEQRGSDVHMEGRFNQDESRWGRWRGNRQVKVRVVVYVPERYNLDFTSGAGNIQIDDLVGSVNGSTGAGNMQIKSVRGSLELSSGSGNIEIARVAGRVKVSTGAGNVTLEDVQGEVDVSTGAGNISAEITRQPEGSSRLESGAGNVTVYLAERVGVTVDASAGLGSASTDFPLKVEGKWMKKSFEGRVNGGGPGLQLRTGVGNVNLKRL